MSVFDVFRNFFGLRRGYGDESHDRGDYSNEPNEGHHNPFWKYNHTEEDGDDELQDFGEQPFGFKIFSNPLEIHRFFEKQLDDMLKTFQRFESESALVLEEFGSVVPSHRFQERAIEGENSPRDEVLKPEYRYRTPGFIERRKREDDDLDESVKGSGLSEILDKEPSQVLVIPDKEMRTERPGIHRFGKSVTSKTIRRPDGSIEYHHRVRDSEGNEKVTVTYQVGDKKRTVVTESDANGILKSTETFENIDDESIEDFKRKWKSSEGPMDQSIKHGGIDFSKFFNLF